MSDDFSIQVSMPLDSDGFLRRECPTCEREFKWFATDAVDEASPVPESGYWCPYCAIQAPPDAWHTKAQVEYMHSVLGREVIAPEMEKLKRTIEGVNRPGGLIEASLDYEVPDEPQPLSDDDDMRRVDFACHQNEPVKVLEDWTSPVHCLLCGTPA